MAPFDWSTSSGSVGYGLLFGGLGIGFGAALEMSGFGDTRKLAAQFYLKEMTVLKVMFTAIIVAAVLIHGASAFGLLDLQRVFVNPTYLWPGIVGGLIMGVGFVVGGFCPGTSLVAASTLKIDGMMFVAGALTGVYLFGETLPGFNEFWLSSAMGRFTLPEWLDLSTGVTLLLVIGMALAMFFGAELCERYFGAKLSWAQISLRPQHLGKVAGAAALVAATLVILVRGQPTLDDRWAFIAPTAQKLVDERAVFVSPAEVVSLRKDPNVTVNLVDLRDETSFNLFHVAGAVRIPPTQLGTPARLRPLLEQGPNAVAFLMSNSEMLALDAWRQLKGAGVVNVYVVEGGINGWLAAYPAPRCVAAPRKPDAQEHDPAAFQFAFATGSALPSAAPELSASRSFRLPCDTEEHTAGTPSIWPEVQFTKKVQMQAKKVIKGGCG